MQYSNSLIDRASLRFLAKSEYPEITRRQPHRLRLALNEAEALACETGFPALFALDLADEKLAALNSWHMRQQRISANPIDGSLSSRAKDPSLFAKSVIQARD